MVFKFITFATANYMRHAQDICESALTHGGFDDSRIFTPSDIDTHFVERCKGILQCPRGYGYWLWKPYVILKTLCERCNDGDVLVYCDSQFVFIDDIKPFLLEQLEVSSSPYGIAIPRNKPNEPSYPEHQWTKGDAFNIILSKREACDDTYQAWGGFIAVKRSTSSIAFIAAWLAYAEDSRIITDIPTQIIPNHQSFKENRHDQTVLSLIAKRYKIPFFHFPTKYLQNLRVPFKV